MPKCSRCDHVAPSLGLLRKHAAETHAGAVKRKKKKKNVVETAPVVLADRERALLDAASDLFDTELVAEELTADGYDRVLSYLQSRYGSPNEAVAT